MTSIDKFACSVVPSQVVSLLFCPDHAEQIKRKEVGVVLASSFKELLGYDVLTWQMGSGEEKTETKCKKEEVSNDFLS